MHRENKKVKLSERVLQVVNVIPPSLVSLCLTAHRRTCQLRCLDLIKDGLSPKCQEVKMQPRLKSYTIILIKTVIT